MNVGAGITVIAIAVFGNAACTRWHYREKATSGASTVMVGDDHTDQQDLSTIGDQVSQIDRLRSIQRHLRDASHVRTTFKGSPHLVDDHCNEGAFYGWKPHLLDSLDCPPQADSDAIAGLSTVNPHRITVDSFPQSVQEPSTVGQSRHYHGSILVTATGSSEMKIDGFHDCHRSPSHRLCYSGLAQCSNVGKIAVFYCRVVVGYGVKLECFHLQHTHLRLHATNSSVFTANSALDAIDITVVSRD